MAEMRHAEKGPIFDIEAPEETRDLRDRAHGVNDRQPPRRLLQHQSAGRCQPSADLEGLVPTLPAAFVWT